MDSLNLKITKYNISITQSINIYLAVFEIRTAIYLKQSPPKAEEILPLLIITIYSRIDRQEPKVIDHY